MSKLRVGFIGITGMARNNLNGLKEAANLELVAISDINADEAKKVGKEFEVPVYKNYKRMMTSVKMDAVLMSLPHFVYPDAVKAAARRDLHVWKEKPLGRNFKEGLKLVKLMESKNLKFMLGTQRRFMTSFQRMKVMTSRIGKIFMVRGQYVFCWGPDFGWRRSLEKGGGGALLDMGYHTVDMVVWLMGLPDEVYCMATNNARPNTPYPYETEDSAVTFLKYGDGRMGYLFTSWASAPEEERFILHGTEGVIEADRDGLTLHSPQGDVLEKVKKEDVETSPNYPYRSQLEHFASAVLENQVDYLSSGRENLKNMALIEAAYKSVASGKPQNPKKILAKAKLEI